MTALCKCKGVNLNPRRGVAKTETAKKRPKQKIEKNGATPRQKVKVFSSFFHNSPFALRHGLDGQRS
jgi:hypothetical protein